MKRFLVFLMVAIAVTSLGLTIYYFSKDNEVIFINNTQISVNVGDTFSTDSLLKFENASKYTKVDYNGVQDSGVLSYNKNEGFYAAISGGETKIVITTNNRSYSSLVINVIVRDGTEEFPYIIDSESKLRLIGNDTKFTAEAHYELGKSIILSDKWTPIANFTGSIDGAGYTISNMDISEYTQAEIDKTKVDNGGNLENTEKTQKYLDYNSALVSTEYAGFVGTLKSETSVAKISNLTIKNANIVGNFSYVGIIAGCNEGEIHNCHVSTDSYVELEYADGQVISEKTIFNNIQSSNGSATIGGVAGLSINYVRNDGGITKSYSPIIERCSSSARIFINGTSQDVGGVVGRMGSSQVTECMFDGYALANTGAYFGGIVGTNASTSESTIIDNLAVINTLETSPVTQVGGIVYKNISTGNADRDHHIFGVYHSALRTYKEDGTFSETTIETVNAGDKDVVKNSCMLTATQLKATESFETYRQVVDGGVDYVRTWDFENVWKMSDNYPIIDKSSVSGSIYQIDYSKVKGTNDFSTSDDASTIYNRLASEANGSFNIAGDIDMNGFEWNPIEKFEGILTGSQVNDGGVLRNPIVSNITLVLENANKNQGLFNKIESTAIISNITFDNVTIKCAGSNGSVRYIGTLAGENNGAIVNNVSVKNIKVENLTIVGFGGLVGYNDVNAGKTMANVSATNVTFTNSYARCAGGIAGYNGGIITGDVATSTYVNASNINVVATQFGGIAGINGGTIAYATADTTYSITKANANVYDGSYSYLQAGGIAGYNKVSGIIKTTKASLQAQVDSDKNFNVYVGGIAGYNAGVIYDSHTTNTNVTSNYSYKATIGGIAGTSTGYIDGCLVDSTSIKASTTCIEKSSETYVGGLVGLLASSKEKMRAGFIGYSVSKATSLEGFYVGGLVGYSYGAVYKAYAEGTQIKGFYAGGIAGVINAVVSGKTVLTSWNDNFKSGSYKYCYSNVSLENVNSAIDMSNLATSDIYNNVVSYDKGASAGVAVLVVANTVVDNCYVVIDFKGDGAKASTTISRNCGGTAKEREVAYAGIIKNTIFTNKQISTGVEGGKYVEKTSLIPSEGTRYRVFEENGLDSDVWAVDIGELPTIAGLDTYIQNNIIA